MSGLTDREVEDMSREELVDTAMQLQLALQGTLILHRVVIDCLAFQGGVVSHEAVHQSRAFFFFQHSLFKIYHPCADLSTRVEGVKSENATMRTENGVLKDYIDNLLAKVNEGPAQGQLRAARGATRAAGAPPGGSQAVQVNAHIGELRAGGQQAQGRR
jgi:hypothetical protein